MNRTSGQSPLGLGLLYLSPPVSVVRVDISRSCDLRT